MSFLALQEILRNEIASSAKAAFGVELDSVPCEVPPRTELGDLAFPVSFELAKRIKQATGDKRNPREIAETLKKSLEAFGFVDRVEVAGAGYLNVFYDRATFLAENSARELLAGSASGVS